MLADELHGLLRLLPWALLVWTEMSMSGAFYFVPCFVSAGRFVTSSDVDMYWYHGVLDFKKALGSDLEDHEDDLACTSLAAAHAVCRHIYEIRKAAGLEPETLGIMPLTEDGSIMKPLAFNGSGPGALFPNISDHYSEIRCMDSMPPGVRGNANLCHDELRGYFMAFRAHDAEIALAENRNNGDS